MQVLKPQYRLNMGLILVLSLMASVAVLILSIIEPFYGVFLGLSLIAGVIILKNPLYGLSIMVFITPFINNPFTDKPIGGVSGLKLQIIIPVLVFVFTILLSQKYELREVDRNLMIIYFFFFTVALFRSIPYMKYHMFELWGEDFVLSRFIISQYFRQLMYFLVVLFIPLLLRSREKLKNMLNMVLASMTLLSLVVLVMYAIFRNNSMEYIRGAYSQVIGMHGNDIVNYFIVTIPLIMGMMFYNPKKIIYKAIFFLSICAVGVLFSRGGYIAVAMEVFVYLIVTKKYKLIVSLAVTSPLLYLAIPSAIIDRFNYGMSAGGLNDISAGRTGNIWTPLIRELSENINFLIFGNGRFGIMNTEAYNTYFPRRASHAHNMFLDTILDGGVILLVFMLSFCAYYMFRCYMSHKVTKDKFYQFVLSGCGVGILGYLFRGISDATFFPSQLNAEFWIIVGIGIMTTYIVATEEKTRDT